MISIVWITFIFVTRMQVVHNLDYYNYYIIIQYVHAMHMQMQTLHNRYVTIN